MDVKYFLFQLWQWLQLKEHVPTCWRAGRLFAHAVWWSGLRGLTVCLFVCLLFTVRWVASEPGLHAALLWLISSLPESLSGEAGLLQSNLKRPQERRSSGNLITAGMAKRTRHGNGNVNQIEFTEGQPQPLSAGSCCKWLRGLLQCGGSLTHWYRERQMSVLVYFFCFY